MVKRFLASLLATTMTLSMGATAFAAEAKPENARAAAAAAEEWDNVYKFKQDTVFFDVNGKVQDIYKINKDIYMINKDTASKKDIKDTKKQEQIGYFAGATEYFINKDTSVVDKDSFARWMNLETGVYYLANDVKTQIPNEKAVWTAQFKAPAEVKHPVDKVEKGDLDKALEAAEKTGSVSLGADLYAVEAKGDKIGTAPVKSSAEITLDADVKKALADAKKEVTLSTGIASLTVPADKAVSFKAELTVANEAVGKENRVENAVAYDFTADGKASHDFGTSVTVKVPVAIPGVTETTAHVYYIENGEPKYRLDKPATYKNGILTFTTTHFSTYAISTEKNDKIPTETEFNKPEKPKFSFEVKFEKAEGTVEADLKTGKLTIKPKDGYELAGISVDGKAVDKPTLDYVVTDTNAKVVNVTFKKISGNLPNISINGEGGKYEYDENTGTLTIIPDKGYMVKDVTLNGQSKGTPLTLTNLKAGDVVVITFKKLSVTEPNIFVDGVGGKFNYDSKTGIVTFLPDQGYELKDVVLNDEHLGVVSSVTVKAGDVVVITFGEVSGGGSGGSGGGSSSGGSTSGSKPSVSVNGEGGKIVADDKGNVTITPDKDYRVKDVTVNGKSVGAVESLTGIKASDKVVVTFEKIPTDPSGWANPFTDVADGAWYYDAVKYAHENNLFSGVSSDKFAPTNTMNRAMLVTVLYRLSGSTETGKASFADVAEGTYYADAVAWAEKNKIVTGISATEFAPNKNVTREQIAAILNRYAKFAGKTLPAGSLDFSDATQISEYAKADVAAMQAAGIVNGRNNGAFAPKASATRAEVAAMVMRYVDFKG